MMTDFEKPKFDTESGRRLDIPEGMWTKCPKCGEVLYNKLLEENQMVCSKCENHFTIGGMARIECLVDPESFEEHDANLTAVDVLKFTGVASYTDKLASYQKETGLKDAVISGMGKINGHEFSISVMDFNFLAASMGSVVGEKITRAVERATKKKVPVVIISASGGARMYEGMFSLMQMAKTSAALARHAQARLPFVSVLTHPTMAGVMASFASLGDVIISEPGAMVGFAGARVIKDTTQQELPRGFQTAEFLLERGLIDMIVPRKQMKATLHNLFEYMNGGNGEKGRAK